MKIYTVQARKGMTIIAHKVFQWSVDAHKYCDSLIAKFDMKYEITDDANEQEFLFSCRLK